MYFKKNKFQIWWSFLFIVVGCKTLPQSNSDLAANMDPKPSEWLYRCDFSSGNKFADKIYLNNKTPDGSKGMAVFYDIPGGVGRETAKKGRDQSGDRVEYTWSYSDDYTDIKYVAKIDKKFFDGVKKLRLNLRKEDSGKKLEGEFSCKTDWKLASKKDQESERVEDENADYADNKSFKYRCQQSGGDKYFGSDLMFIAPGTALKILYRNHEGAMARDVLKDSKSGSGGTRVYNFADNGDWETSKYQLTIGRGLAEGSDSKGSVRLAISVDDGETLTASLDCSINKNK